MANTTNPIDADRIARVAYLAYGERVDFRNYRGEPMPLFDDLGDTIQDAWRRATTAAIRAVLNDLTVVLHQFTERQ